MPLDARLLDDARLIYLRFHGKQDVAEIRDTMIRFRAQPGYDGTLPELGDLRGVMSSGFGLNQIRPLVRLASTRQPGGTRQKRICLLTGSLAQYGTARMFSSLSEVLPATSELEVRIEETEVAALAFLGRSEARLVAVPGFEPRPCAPPCAPG